MQTVSYEDVEQYLRLLRNDCSTAYENIPAMLIKPVVEFLVSPLTFVINNYIATKQLSRCLENSKNQSNTKNNTTCGIKRLYYRPVSILPVLSKVYEKL